MMVKLILKEDTQIEEIIIHIKNYLKLKITTSEMKRLMKKIIKISPILPT